ncbi:DMT family transporter [Streptomyces sp. NBC_01497]|uniref:DMT family transporter n=1 Tax=Streptomyces sp. NBC_01497 TaxID=2903885 RepID=UPI002E354E25|nr:DMT family transporter [Streptomyces sp. NBC_01497]
MNARPWPRPTRGNLRLAAVLGLLTVTAIWGATFLVVKDATAHMSVWGFLAWRFGIAAVAMAALRPAAVLRIRRDTLGPGAGAGLLLGASYILQTFGLQHTSAAISGFLTGLFVVFTPVLALLLLRERLSPPAWAAVVTAAVGLGLITITGVAFGAGEVLTLLCAVCFALHLLALGRWSPGRDAYALTVVQLGTACLMSVLGGLVQGPSGLRPPENWSAWTGVLVTALLASAFAYMVQTWAQTHMTPTQAAVVLTMEPVFAGVFAVLVGGERLTIATLVGGALVVAAMFLVEVPGASSGKDPQTVDSAPPASGGGPGGTDATGKADRGAGGRSGDAETGGSTGKSDDARASGATAGARRRDTPDEATR